LPPGVALHGIRRCRRTPTAQGTGMSEGVRQQSRRRKEITKRDWINLGKIHRRPREDLRSRSSNIFFEKDQGKKPQRSEIGFYKRTFSSLRIETSMPTREQSLAYTDPNGRCLHRLAVKGSVGICIEAFIEVRQYSVQEATIETLLLTIRKTNRIQVRGVTALRAFWWHTILDNRRVSQFSGWTGLPGTISGS